MKFFIDTANVDEIRKANDMGVIAGVTTNPSLIAKEGRDYAETLAEIATIVDGPISGEVKATTTDAETMVKEGEAIYALDPKHMVVKIPMTAEGLKAIKALSAKGIPTNCTLIFSANQALLAARAGATYVSPFLGRLDDISQRGTELIETIHDMFLNYPDIETHPLGIGMNEKDPARLVFEGKPGKAIVVSLIDMGGRLRLICQDIECVKPILPMPNLPVARVMWKALPSLTTGVECWITAGGAHHTVLSYDVTAEQMHDWANIMGIEFVHIGKDTTPEGLEHDLFLADLAWKLK